MELVLHQFVDYGTKNLSVGTQIGPVTEEPHPGKTAILSLQAGRDEVPQIVGYVRRDNKLEFVTGYELKKLLSSKHADTVAAAFERLKLAVLGTAKESLAIRKQIKAVLKTLSVPEKNADDLFARHLKAIKAELASAVTEKYRFGTQDVSNMESFVFFAVPKITNLGNRHKLSQLLKLAGFPETQLVSETEAAGAWHAFKHCSGGSESHNLFSPGKELLVVDLGGWTCNIASYTITGPTEDGARIGMKATGKKASHALGSEMLNIRFFKFARTQIDAQEGEPVEVLERLGISANTLDHVLSRDFESFKVNFEDEQSRTISIKGLDTGRHFQEHKKTMTVNVEVDAENVTKWLDEALKKIIPAIDNVRSKNPTVISMTGGFSLNTYLIKKVREHYRTLGVTVINSGKDDYGSADLAVVRGSAARRKVQTEESMPFKYALGMAQDEYWDPEEHPDIVEDSDAIIRIDGLKYVTDRWRTLLPLGTPLNSIGGKPNTYRYWLEFHVPEKAWMVTKKIYFTEADIPEHADLYPDGRSRKDIEVFDEITCKLSLDEVKRMKKVHEPADLAEREFQQEYHINILFTIQVDGMNVSMKLERTPDGYDMYRHFYEDTGELVPAGSEDDTATRKQVQRWHEPPAEEMVPVTTTTLLDAKYHPELQRREGTEGTSEGEGDDRRPSTKRRRKD